MKKVFAIFVAYYRRITESAVGKLFAAIGKGKPRTSNTEPGTSNADGAASESSDPTSAVAKDSILPAPPPDTERNEMKGVDKNQPSMANPGNATPLISTSSKLFPTDIAAAPPGTATVPAASSATGERDARGPRQQTPGNSPPLAHATRTSGFTPDFISRDEFKRELDSLRRLIETKGR